MGVLDLVGGFFVTVEMHEENKQEYFAYINYHTELRMVVS
jgi:hypothetical protein